MPKEKCREELIKTGELTPNFSVHESFICAGGVKGEDTVIFYEIKHLLLSHLKIVFSVREMVVHH